MELIHFESWPEVLAYAETGEPLYYKAPLDRYPARLTPSDPGARSAFTYQAQARTIKVWPAGSVGRGRNRTADPFTADAGHLDRFLRPVEEHGARESVRETKTHEASRDSTDPQYLHDILEKGILLNKDRVEGSVDLNDSSPVHVGIIVDVQGYGPHVGAMYVDQNRFHGSSDTAFQGADEILEQWTLDNTSKEDIDELEAEYGDDWMSVLTETFDGWAFTLQPHEFVNAIRGTDAEQFVDVEPEEEEEPEDDEEPEEEEDDAPEADAKDILEGLGQYLEHEGHDAARESARIARLIAGAGSSDKVDKVLEEVNRLVDGSGVEAINGDYHVDGYYGDIVALYVNMGDTYNTTLLYETDRDRFLVTSWGDWVEQNERKYKIQ